jgi:transcriptional regulator with XRE-family HTH domain
MESILTPSELEIMLGENIKTLRLQQNLDRQSLCNQAGISLNALRHLEGGKGATLKTLVRVIKALNRENWLSAIAPQVSINPLHMIRQKRPRQRASKRSYEKKE